MLSLAWKICVSFLLVTTGFTNAQEAADPHVKAIEAAGGRVSKISAADDSREISFALSDKAVGDSQLSGVNKVGSVIWLNLAGTKITDAGLANLKGMPLQKLHLEKTKIGDEGLKHLKGFKDLQYLNLYDTQVSDAGLEHLKSLKGLKKLYVWKSKVTEAGMKKLNESLPELKIIGELKLEPVVIEDPKKTKADNKAAEKKPAKKKEVSEKQDKAQPAKPKKKEGADKAQSKSGK